MGTGEANPSMKSASIWLIAPYALWMLLMTVLPSTLGGYAVRTVLVTLALVASFHRLHFSSGFRLSFLRLIPCSVLVGLLVFAIWIAPEQFDCRWYREWCIVGDAPSVPESDFALVAMRLIGSAFVIAVAEELFFRRWLVDFAGFWWMVALFAVEHDRWLVGLIAGVAYGLLSIRRGLGSAIVAHVTTNLALGVWVLISGQWQFW